MGDEQAIYEDDPVDYYKELLSERKSHDAEIRRIGEKLGLKWPCTIEDIIKAISELQVHDKLLRILATP